MSLENLWNHRYWVAAIDIWGKWTNLTTWQSLVHLQTAFEMNNKAIFPPSGGIYHSKTVVILASCDSKLSHQLFRVMLVSDLIQETGRVPRTGITRQEIQSPSINQLKILDTRYCRHWPLDWKRTKSCGCSPMNKVTRLKFRCLECNVGSCATVFWRITLTCVPEDHLTLNWKSRATDISKYCHCYYWSDIFYYHFHYEITGMKWEWNRSFSEGPLYAYMFSFSTLWKKKISIATCRLL
jgi:hypothetical protein